MPSRRILRYNSRMIEHKQKLAADQILFSIPEESIHRLRLNCDVNPIIGQDRAVNALELGLGIRANGYNIFIMGSSGSGRRTVLTSLLANYKANPEDLQDIAYVCNFSRPLEPKALFFPAGSGASFKKSLHSAIETIRKQALQISKTEDFTTASKKIIATSDTDENKLLSEFETRMSGEGFKLLQVKDDDARSMDLLPLIRGKTVSFDDLQIRVTQGKMQADTLNAMREKYYRCLDQMASLFA